MSERTEVISRYLAHRVARIPSTPFVGQTWLPRKRGTGWRNVVEVDLSTVVYTTHRGGRHRLWHWEWDDWCRRFDCWGTPRPWEGDGA